MKLYYGCTIDDLVSHFKNCVSFWLGLAVCTFSLRMGPVYYLHYRALLLGI